jgi:hypothetical protein
METSVVHLNTTSPTQVISDSFHSQIVFKVSWNAVLPSNYNRFGVQMHFVSKGNNSPYQGLGTISVTFGNTNLSITDGNINSYIFSNFHPEFRHTTSKGYSNNFDYETYDCIINRPLQDTISILMYQFGGGNLSTADTIFVFRFIGID